MQIQIAAILTLIGLFLLAVSPWSNSERVYAAQYKAQDK